MLSAALVAHPDTPCPPVRSINVRVERVSDTVVAAQFVVDADLMGLAIPPPAAPARTDRLWQHTCCELFARREGATEYTEFNLSPSTEWAAYSFASYRHGMNPAVVAAAPHIVTTVEGDLWRLDAQVTLPVTLLSTLPRALLLGCTMVVETVATALSYWAVAHAQGPPDFHQARGFALRL
jgi:hypothetical protein